MVGGCTATDVGEFEGRSAVCTYVCVHICVCAADVYMYAWGYVLGVGLIEVS